MISQPVDTIMTALMGTHNILEIAKKHAVNAFVYISSMEVYGSFNDEHMYMKIQWDILIPWL